LTFVLCCDGCGKQEIAPVNSIGDPYNPPGWRSRVESKGTVESAPYKAHFAYHACSEACLKICLEKFGGMVSPL
jgi:hypothetical protein